MNVPHIIRLRGPWRRERLDDPLHEACTVQMPASWCDDLGTSFEGSVTYSRGFHCPTSIDATTPLSLTFQEIVGDAVVWLNNQLLGEIAWPEFPHRFSLTGILQARNELRVEVKSLTREQQRQRDGGRVAEKGGLVGEVHLEIG